MKNYRYQFWGKITLIIRTNVSSLLKEKISLFVGELFSLVKCEIKQSTIDKTLTKLLKKCRKTLIALKCKSLTVTSNPGRPDTAGKSNKNNNQIEHPRKWDLKEWSRPTPGSGCLFKKDLISQFAKELSFKKYFDSGPSPRRLWHVAGFFHEFSSGGMSLTLYRLCCERLSAGLLGLASHLQTGGFLHNTHLKKTPQIQFYLLHTRTHRHTHVN